MPTFLQVVQFFSRIILRILSRTRITGLEHVPKSGGAIVVTNHLGRLDAMLGVVLTDRHDFIMLIADKYQSSRLWNWWARRIDAIWLNREEADFHAMRAVLKRLSAGEILGMAPEGTRSETEALQPGRHGAAYLAAKAGVPIIPVGLTGTEDRVVYERFKRLRRLDIDIHIGEAFTLPPMDRKDREGYLDRSTDEIMCQIAAQLPPKYRGVYADHPRLQELLADQSAALVGSGVEE